MNSDCQRCGGHGTIRLETHNPNRWIDHWCPDCSRPPRVDEHGEWTQQPFRYQGQMTHEIESYAEYALLHDLPLYWPRSGLRVREPWWRDQQRLRDTLWGWRKTRRTTHGKQGYARDGSGRLCDQARSSMSRSCLGPLAVLGARLRHVGLALQPVCIELCYDELWLWQ